MNLHSPLYQAAALLGLAVGLAIVVVPKIGEVCSTISHFTQGLNPVVRAERLFVKVKAASYYPEAFDECHLSSVMRIIDVARFTGSGIADNAASVRHLKVVLNFLTVRHAELVDAAELEAAIAGLEGMSAAHIPAAA